MAHPNGASGDDTTQADFAKALREIREGEQQATMMEKNLTALEKKIDDLLAQAESQEREMQTRQAAQADSASRALGDDKAPEEQNEEKRE